MQHSLALNWYNIGLILPDLRYGTRSSGKNRRVVQRGSSFNMKVELLKQGVHDVSNALEEVSAIMACVGERHDDRTSCAFNNALPYSHTLAVS